MTRVGSTVHQQLTYAHLTMLGCIVQCRLAMYVNVVDISSHGQEGSDDLCPAISACIVDRSLSILVFIVQIASVLDHDLSHLELVLSRCIEESTLLQGVFVLGIDTLLDQEVGHVSRLLRVLDEGGPVDGSLLEGLIPDVRQSHSEGIHFLPHCFDVTLLHSVNDALHLLLAWWHHIHTRHAWCLLVS